MIVAIPVVFSPKILPFHIKKAPNNANKIPNSFWFFIVIIFLLSNYADPCPILPKNRLIGDFSMQFHPNIYEFIQSSSPGATLLEPV